MSENLNALIIIINNKNGQNHLVMLRYGVHLQPLLIVNVYHSHILMLLTVKR